ncbi:MAG: hypothetical protein KDJ35_09210 [Alphaproteobacteria bacterium]|nr:hypothetical protein [Alphaproteobacteria bacterium]
MTLDVETVVAVSIMMAVFSAVAAVGTSIVLGAGFERLRSGFEVIKKQTGFFSDTLYKLEKKVEVVDEQTNNFSNSIETLKAQVSGVGEQANAFSASMQKLEKKVEVVDKQAGFFGNAIHNLEKKIDTIGQHEQIVSEKMEKAAGTDLISTGKAEALVSHAEDLLTQVSMLADKIQTQDIRQQTAQDLRLSLPQNLLHYAHKGYAQESEEARYH